VNDCVLHELKRIIQDSQILKESDNQWPKPDKIGSQELEIVIDDSHKFFKTSKIGSVVEVSDSKDPEGLRVFFYMI
jgi:protein mago nashi